MLVATAVTVQVVPPFQVVIQAVVEVLNIITPMVIVDQVVEFLDMMVINLVMFINSNHHN